MERERLHVIEGLPPDLIDMAPGCPFKPRCPFATDQCNETPPLREVGDGHLSACWFADDLDELNKKRIEKIQRGEI
jgi:oligopeptide/dipeptide ABC transporter ATP-binding protein